MADLSNHSAALDSLRRLNQKFDGLGDEVNQFMQHQANGEQPDPALFMKLMEQRSVVRDAMEAQYKLYEKPLKTVMTETR